MLQITPQTANTPFHQGEVLRSSDALPLVEIQKDGPALLMHERYCSTLFDQGTPAVRTENFDGFMASLRPPSQSPPLQDVHGHWPLIQQECIEVCGAMLDSPETDPLPLHRDSPRVEDQDSDDNPGVSVSVEILGLIRGEVFVAQRIRYPLSGSVVSRDLAEGTIAWSDEQAMLSGTERLLLVCLQGPFDTEQLKEGVFLMQVMPRSWTCRMLREGWPSLFDLTSPGEQP